MTIDPGLRRTRGGALACGAIGAASVVSVNLLPIERLRAEPGWFLRLPLALWIRLPLLYTAVFWAPARHPAPGFHLGRRRRQPAFASPARPLLTGLIFISNAFAASNFASQRATRELFSGTTYLIVAATQVIAAVLLVGLGLSNLYRARPLRLTPEGIHRPLRRTIRWDDLAPGGPARHHLHGTTLWLLLRNHQPRPRPGTGLNTEAERRDPGPGVGYHWYALDLRGVFVDREFLTAAIRYYRDNPTARTRIGTPDGLRQLIDVSTPHQGWTPTSPSGG